jgi:uncharacterized protein (DUF4415 family)
MKNKMVRTTIDLANPPALTPAQRAELDALDAMPDSEIDYSDIPPLDESFWKNAVRNPFYRPTKTSTTVRIDSDVLHWLRTHGKGYQSRINAILRREMLASLKTSSAPAPKSRRTSRSPASSSSRPAARRYTRSGRSA